MCVHVHVVECVCVYPDINPTPISTYINVSYDYVLIVLAHVNIYAHVHLIIKVYA